MLLIIHGRNSLDIFKTLVQILKAKCIELFGETLTVSRATFEKDTEPLKLFFQEVGIKLLLDLQKDISEKTCDSKCELKDYKLWIEMPCKFHLVVSFDYECHKSTACHLE